MEIEALLIGAIILVAVVWAVLSIAAHATLRPLLRDLDAGLFGNDGAWHIFLTFTGLAFIAEVVGTTACLYLTNAGPLLVALSVGYFVLKLGLLLSVAVSRCYLGIAPFRQFAWLVAGPHAILAFFLFRCAAIGYTTQYQPHLEARWIEESALIMGPSTGAYVKWLPPTGPALAPAKL
jgi:hypothetical protein